MAHDLAGACARYLIDELEVGGNLEFREALGGEAAQVVYAEALVATYHECDDDLTERMIGFADNCCIADPGMLSDCLLDLGGIDVLAAANDALLDPAGDGQVTV